MSGEQRWYVNEAHHRAILDGAQHTIDRLGIEGTSDYGDHQEELLGALDLIVVLRLELAAQARALPDRNVLAEAIGRACIHPDAKVGDIADAVLALLKR